MKHKRTAMRTAGAETNAAAKATSESDAQLTTSPVRAANLSQAQPEFGRVHDLKPLFGIRRGHAYALMHDGEIRSVSLRRRGYKLGIRLVDLQSVRDYLERQAKEPSFPTKATKGVVTE